MKILFILTPSNSDGAKVAPEPGSGSTAVFKTLNNNLKLSF